MKTTKKEDYAVLLMTALAKQSEYVSLKKVAESYSLPYPFMKQIANSLVKADLLETKGGVTGGYKLARSADEISWKDILIAVEGTPKFTDCVKGKGSKCPMLGKCPAAHAWRELQTVILDSLEEVKLSKFVKK